MPGRTPSRTLKPRTAGVSITLQVVPTNNYTSVLSARLAAGGLDIGEGAHTGVAAQPNPSYVKGPEPTFITQIDAHDWVNFATQPFIKYFNPSVIQDLTYKKGVYGLPQDLVIYSGVFYNKTIFAKYHLSVPTTWNQLLTVCQVLKSHGVTPFITGGKDVWPPEFTSFDIALSLLGEQGMKAFATGLWTGKASLTSPVALKVMNETKTVFSFTVPSFSGIAYTETPQLFATGAAAMMLDGAWSAPTIAAVSKTFQFGYFPFPGSNNNAANAVYGGSIDDVLSIPASSKNIPLAEKFLGFWASPAQYQQYIQIIGNPPAEPHITATPFIDSLSKYPFTLAWNQLFYPSVKSSPLSETPWAYTYVTPMGPYTDMGLLTKAMQADWRKSI